MYKADITKYQQKFWQKVEILSAAASAASATQNRIAKLYPQLSANLFLQFLQVQLFLSPELMLRVLRLLYFDNLMQRYQHFDLLSA